MCVFALPGSFKDYLYNITIFFQGEFFCFKFIGTYFHSFVNNTNRWHEVFGCMMIKAAFGENSKIKGYS